MRVLTRFVTVGLLAVVALAGCTTPEEPAPSATSSGGAATGSTGGTGLESPSASPTPTLAVPSPASPRPGTTLTGTVFHSDLEGGCLGLTGDDGKNYELLGSADREVLTPGTRVRVSGRVRTDVATVCQIGTPFEVTSAERL